jgi:hypothetical protein
VERLVLAVLLTKTIVEMNFLSPLSKDTRQKKEKKEETFAKEKPKISLATVKKLLKPLKVDVGVSECRWVNQYMESEVRSACLPMSLLGNDLMSEIQRIFGVEGAEAFLAKVRAAFQQSAPKNPPLMNAQPS